MGYKQNGLVNTNVINIVIRVMKNTMWYYYPKVSGVVLGR